MIKYKFWVNISIVYILINISLIFLFSNCSLENEELSLGSDFVESSTDIIEVDTFYLELSTVLLDSIKTSNLGVVLSGCYEDSIIGKIKATSYMRFGAPADFDIENSDIYDSLTLVLPYSDYSFGDTNLVQQILIYRLSENIELAANSGKFYNTSELNKYEIPLASYSFYPRPKKDTIVEIRLSNELGLDILNKIKSNAIEVSSTVEFQKYFFGIAITTDDLQGNSIIGFEGDDVKMKLYVSRITEESKQLIYEFSNDSKSYQFNQISGDRTNSLLNNLSVQEGSLNSIYTNNKSYILGGCGILTKIRFPYFKAGIFNENDLILDAELILRPSPENYNTGFPDLVFYKTNEYNDFEVINADVNGNPEVAKFNNDELYKEDTYYSFDLTDFFKAELEKDYFDNNIGLFVTLNSPYFNTTVDRMILYGNGNYKKRPILKITYLKI